MRTPPGRPADDPPWWRSAVVYEIYVRSFADASGDGIGDLEGIRTHLDHLVDLGVDAVWLTPFYPSPMADHGYDVADPRGVDPLFGSLDDVDRLVADAHARHLRVLVDVVPNHTSSAHPWFVQALADGPGAPARERYLFRPGRGAQGAEPPNNWDAVFGGPAWTRAPDGEWYLHLFTPEQPDLNWRHPDVARDHERTLRFWLDRGVDGFRIDVAHGLFKDPALPDAAASSLDLLAPSLPPLPMWNQPEVHDVYRRWRQLCAGYAHEPVLVGEVWIGDPDAVAAYVRPDELHLAFNFRLLFARWRAPDLRAAIAGSLASLGRVGAVPTWVFGNHDVARQASRFGSGPAGARRARAAALLLLALPGPAFLYAGEELGLPEAEVPDEALQDPIWERSGHTIRGRDGCRVPLPWAGAGPAYGFSSTTPWLPMPPDWTGLTVEAQRGDASSTLGLYRAALVLRRSESALGAGSLAWNTPESSTVDFTCRPPGEGRAVRCLLNVGREGVPLPAGEMLLASSPLEGSTVPPDTCVWLAG